MRLLEVSTVLHAYIDGEVGLERSDSTISKFDHGIRNAVNSRTDCVLNRARMLRIPLLLAVVKRGLDTGDIDITKRGPRLLTDSP